MVQFSALLLLLALTGAQALDNGLLRTPPMGWMSWTAFYCEMDCQRHPTTCISEQLYKQMADHLVSDGYSAAGYTYVHVDDCWMERSRDSRGVLVSDQQRFPSGMKALANYVQAKGLKFGIYEDYGTKTCAGFPGSYGFLKLDADTFAAWEVDYLKLDGCNIDLSLMSVGYPEMAQRLNQSGRAIAYSCSWPAYLIDQPHLVDYNVIGHYCNLWRNYVDIASSWTSIAGIINYYDHMQDKHIPTHGPGHWHDPDMIVVGNQGITVDMSKAQMTIWSIWSAPLIMSNDLRSIGPEFREILLNSRVIAVDQDPLGIMGRLVANTTYVGVYVKPMTPARGGVFSYAIAALNRHWTTKMNVGFILKDLGLKNPAKYHIQDLWSGEVKGVFGPEDRYETIVNPTGVDFIKATPLNFHNNRPW